MSNTIKRNKKILFLTHAMAGGGAERAIVEVINNLDRTRYTPSLALFKKQGPYLSHLKQDIKIYELLRCDKDYKYDELFLSSKYIPSLIREANPSLIISHLSFPNAALLRSTLTCKIQAPIIICEQNNLSLNLKQKFKPLHRSIKRLEIKLLYRRAARIVAVSRGVKEDLVNNHGIPEKYITIIHNPVNIDTIQNLIHKGGANKDQETNNVKHVVAVGRLTRQKGFSDLIDAFEKVLEKIPAKLTILGEGEDRNALEKQIDNLGLYGKIELPGFVNDPWPFIHASDLYVMSSYWEGLPLVLLEVMACKVPIVSTDCNYGPSEIITNSVDGLLVPVGDIDAMSRAMLSVLNNGQLGRHLAKNAGEKVKLFDSKVITKQFEGLFDAMISKRQNA